MATIIPFAPNTEQFKAVPNVLFEATNDEWALEHLPTVRLAIDSSRWAERLA